MEDSQIPIVFVVTFLLLFLVGRLIAFLGEKMKVKLMLQGEVRNVTNIANRLRINHCKSRKYRESKYTYSYLLIPRSP